MGEVVAFAQVLSHEGMLQAIQERVHFARARFGHYYLIDFGVERDGTVYELFVSTLPSPAFAPLGCTRPLPASRIV